MRFLVEPFLESPESLRVDCEINPRQAKAWVRLAFDEAEKGRVYGRGGRNIQAIRTVLAAVAKSAGHSAYLDIYEEKSDNDRSFESRSDRDRPSQRQSQSRPNRRPSRVETPRLRSGSDDRR